MPCACPTPGRPSASKCPPRRAWATAVVCDEGPGVPESERELIFERFQRGSSAVGRAGFGLGLAIGRELADRMGGSLDAGLTGDDGSGARFALRLPLRREHDARARPR